jgi:3-keto-5-aminohexanoate cleavage enzyme
MGFFDQGRVMVRAGPNEFQPKALNRNIPYGAEEIAADAVACARQGASIVHFHSRLDDGAQALGDDRNGAGIYRRALALTARDSDILMEPTNLRQGHDPALAVDLPHVWALLDDPPPGAPLEVINIDSYRFDHRRSGWDPARERLVVIDNYRFDPEARFEGPEAIRAVLARGLAPFYGVFDLADVRLLAAFAKAGLTPQPVLMQINFFYDMIRGPTPSLEALDAFLAEWRRHGIDGEVCLFVRNVPDRATYQALFEGALDRGVHPRVGLGDNPALFGAVSNADLVAHAVEMAGRRGLSPVTPNELRARAGLPQRAGGPCIDPPGGAIHN